MNKWKDKYRLQREYEEANWRLHKRIFGRIGEPLSGFPVSTRSAAYGLLDGENLIENRLTVGEYRHRLPNIYYPE